MPSGEAVDPALEHLLGAAGHQQHAEPVHRLPIRRSASETSEATALRLSLAPGTIERARCRSRARPSAPRGPRRRGPRTAAGERRPRPGRSPPPATTAPGRCRCAGPARETFSPATAEGRVEHPAGGRRVVVGKHDQRPAAAPSPAVATTFQVRLRRPAASARRGCHSKRRRRSRRPRGAQYRRHAAAGRGREGAGDEARDAQWQQLSRVPVVELLLLDARGRAGAVDPLGDPLGGLALRLRPARRSRGPGSRPPLRGSLG